MVGGQRDSAVSNLPKDGSLRSRPSTTPLRDAVPLPCKSRRGPKCLILQIAGEGLGQEEEADDDGQRRDRNRVPEAVIDVAGRGDHGEGGGRQEAAEPA